MLQIMPESEGNVLGIKGSGKLSEKDYEELLLPHLNIILNGHDKARFLFYMDEDFRGWDAEAMWHYAKFGFKHRNRFEKVAAVCGPTWVHWWMKLKSRFMLGSVKTFPCGQLPEAWEWVKS